MKELFKRLMRRDVQKYILKELESQLTYTLGLGGIAGIGVIVHFDAAPAALPIFMLTILAIDHSYKCDSEATYLRSIMVKNDQERAVKLQACRGQRSFASEE